jgi:hypothetical protein
VTAIFHPGGFIQAGKMRSGQLRGKTKKKNVSSENETSSP